MHERRFEAGKTGLVHSKFSLTFQGLALKLRAEGKTYKRQKSDKSSTKAESALSAPKHGAVPQSQPRKQHQQTVPERPETGTRPGGPIQVPRTS